MTLETSKNLGGIGALLIFIGVILFFSPVPFSWVIVLIGVILVLAGLHGLSKYYNSSGIFRNALYGVTVGIVGAIVAVGAAIAAILANLSNIKDFLLRIYPGWNGDWSTLPNMTADTSSLTSTDAVPFLASVILIFIIVLAIICVFSIVSAFFIRRSLKEVSEKSAVGTFGTAGIMLLIGAVLIIFFGLGLLIMWIAALVLAIAFFTLKPHEESPVTTTTYPPPPPTSV